MKFLLGERFFYNFICATWIIPYPRINQDNLIKEKKSKIN